ncbi:MAG: capsule biosynthesis protein [Desulfobulbus sp.]|nr:capsule biosynthesis protein [Desulfobulbus sp.]
MRRINRLFLVIVGLPTLAAIIYYGLIASDIYTSEATFVVRTPERNAMSSSFDSFLQSTGFSSDRSDSYTVQSFITSRDALYQLEKTIDLRAAFSRPEIDCFSRFPGAAWWRTSFEDLYSYYRSKIVAVQIDAASSILTLKIQAFTAHDAVLLNQRLLEISETLVNQLNGRGMRDMISYAATEVAMAEQKAKAAALTLSAYRNKKNVINPEQQSTIQLQQIARLQDELITAQGLLSQLQTLTASNPQIPSLKERVKHLRKEIDQETNKVAGSDHSLAQKAAEYERLALDREFADRQLASTLASLEQARAEALRKQLYLERISQPSTPDMPMTPRRLRGIIAVFFVSLVVYGVCTILLAGVREHRS